MCLCVEACVFTLEKIENIIYNVTIYSIYNDDRDNKIIIINK